MSQPCAKVVVGGFVSLITVPVGLYFDPDFLEISTLTFLTLKSSTLTFERHHHPRFFTKYDD